MLLGGLLINYRQYKDPANLLNYIVNMEFEIRSMKKYLSTIFTIYLLMLYCVKCALNVFLYNLCYCYFQLNCYLTL